MAQIRGPIKLTKFIASMHTSSMAPTDAEQKAYKKTVYEQLLAFIYLTNANQNKYGSLVQGLAIKSMFIGARPIPQDYH